LRDSISTTRRFDAWLRKKNVVEFKNQAYQVETQSPGLTDESINEAKKLIGVDFEESGGRL